MWNHYKIEPNIVKEIDACCGVASLIVPSYIT